MSLTIQTYNQSLFNAYSYLDNQIVSSFSLFYPINTFIDIAPLNISPVISNVDLIYSSDISGNITAHYYPETKPYKPEVIELPVNEIKNVVINVVNLYDKPIYLKTNEICANVKLNKDVMIKVLQKETKSSDNVSSKIQHIHKNIMK